jgi:hypothetical protein
LAAPVVQPVGVKQRVQPVPNQSAHHPRQHPPTDRRDHQDQDQDQTDADQEQDQADVDPRHPHSECGGEFGAPPPAGSDQPATIRADQRVQVDDGGPAGTTAGHHNPRATVAAGTVVRMVP